MKKALSFMLAVIMLVMLIPSAAFAAGDIASGTFEGNDAITWRISSDGTLYIDGKGDMPYEKPWIDLNDQVKSVKVGKGITFVLCLDAPNLKSVSLPDGLTAIGSRCFAGCNKLTSVTLPDSIEVLSDGAFSGSTALESINMPKSLKRTILGTFNGCSSLKTVVFPEGLETIGHNTFAYCKSLTTVYLPKSLATVGWQVFDNCPSLTKVYYAGSSADWEKVAVEDDTRALIKSKMVYNSAAPYISVTAGNNASTGKVTLSWNAVKGAAKYEIWRAGSSTGSFTRQYTTTKTSYTNTGSYAGYTYYYKVKAVKTVASSDYLSDYSVMVSGTSMAKPTVTLAKTDSGIKLTWKAIDGAAKYQVARSTDNKTFKILKTVTGTSLVNTSVTQGTKYYYKVRPVDAKGNTGAYSAVKSYTILGTPTVTAKQSGTSAALSWTKIAGAEKYNIYRSTDGVSFSLLTTVKTTSFTDKSLTKGSTYYYKVKAATSSNSGSFSDVVSLKIMKAPAITLKSSDGAVKLTWKAIDGAVKYQVYRSTDNKSFKLLSTVKGTSLTNSKVTGGTKYYYKLRAVDENGGVSAFSSVKSASVLTAPSLSAKLNGTDVTLSWAKCTGAEKYNIYRAANGGEDELITSTAKLSYTDKGLKKSSEYSYRIQAVSGSSLSKFSSVKSVFVMKAPPLELVNDRGGVKVKWDSVSCSNGSYAVKYELLRSTDGKNYSAVFSGKKISYIDTNVTGNTKYYYKVRAYDSAGGVSVASPVRSIVYLATPDVRSQCDKDGKAYVEWEPVKGATEYRVYAYADPDGMYSPYSDTDRHELLEDMEHKTVKECKYYSNPLATYHVVVAIKHSGDKTYESGVSKIVMLW